VRRRLRVVGEQVDLVVQRRDKGLAPLRLDRIEPRVALFGRNLLTPLYAPSATNRSGVQSYWVTGGTCDASTNVAGKCRSGARLWAPRSGRLYWCGDVRVGGDAESGSILRV
jgi:hypothetical protein